MTLLIFPRETLLPPLDALLDPQLRKNVAQRVNEALLFSQGERTRSKLLELVKTRLFVEKKAREAKKDIPDKLLFGLDHETDRQELREDSIMQNNGDTEIAAS